MFPLIKRHAEALWYVLTVILPILLRTGKRPIIFSKYSGIGDIICTFPAALELKKRHPKATFIYNCHSEFVCLPRMGGVTSHVTSIKAIGLVGYWYRFLLGGYYLFVSDDDRPDRVPTDVYIKDFGRTFGVALDDAHPSLQNDPAVVERVRALLDKKGAKQGPLTVIHAGPSWPVREWPQESWAGLARELEKKGMTNVVQLGTSSHLALGAIDSATVPGVVSLVDQLTLEESCALISLGALFIGIDSGLLHVAVAMRVPSVGLWGATSPQLRFSAENRRLFVVSEVDCQGCHHRVPRLHWMTGCPYDIKCMKAIRVETVLEACLKGLQPVAKSL
jgi:ADP-heptose:LPS heptosyltransferase